MSYDRSFLPSRWRHVGPGFYQCFRWDVCRSDGGSFWELITIYGRAVDGVFTTAAAAMHHAELLDSTPD